MRGNDLKTTYLNENEVVMDMKVNIIYEMSYLNCGRKIKAYERSSKLFKPTFIRYGLRLLVFVLKSSLVSQSTQNGKLLFKIDGETVKSP